MDQPPLLKNVKLVLAGDGPLKAEILEIVTKSSYKHQILFAGFVENIDDYFIISDLVILPSVNEAFGYVLIEALLYNRPVLATSVGGIPDIISHGENGYLYDLTKLEELVMDINRLSLNTNALQALSANSKKILNEKFDVIKNTSSIAALYS
jgi:glycosyltransferase involved in cell wall biosynthesis